METKTQNEAELIARIVAGDKELFHELIRPYERMAYLTVFAVVKNAADAEDGAQEAVISAYRNLKSFRGEAKFSTWLASIAVNEGRKRLRKRKLAAQESVEELEEGRDGDFTPAPLTDWREIPSTRCWKTPLEICGLAQPPACRGGGTENFSRWRTSLIRFMCAPQRKTGTG